MDPSDHTVKPWRGEPSEYFHSMERFVFGPTLKPLMSRRSADNSDRKSSFLGLYVTPQTKKRVKRTAKREGVSISEAVRRRLNDIEDPAGKAHATT